MVMPVVGRRSEDHAGEQNFPAGLRVLVVDDDPTDLTILEKMLVTCIYDVTKTNRAQMGLTLLREKKNGFDIIISNVHMPDMDGFKLLEHVGLEMDLPIIMMSADDSKSVLVKGITHGACDYLIKPVRIEALKNIWQHVVRRKKNEWKDIAQTSRWDEGERQQKQDDAVSSPANEGNLKGSKRKGEVDDDTNDKDDSTTLKKPWVVWSVELHQQFSAAVNQLGIDRAVPKKILELMNVPGLTRENVASHLQKYRLYLKRLSGVSQHQGGMNNTFMSQDAGFGEMSSLSGIDLQTLHATGHLSAQTLAIYTRLPPTLGNINMQASASSRHQSDSLLIQMPPQQCRGQILSESVSGQVSRIPAPIGQPMQSNGSTSAILSRYGMAYNPVSQAGPVGDYSINQISDLPGNSFPLGSTPGLTSITSKGNYDMFTELQSHKPQDWQSQNQNKNFSASFQHATSVKNSMNVPPSVLVNQSFIPTQKNGQNGNALAGKLMFSAGLENQHLGMQKNMNHNLNNGLLDNIPRVKEEKVSDVVSTGASLYSEHYNKEDLTCALLMQQQERTVSGDFDFDGYTLDNIPV